MRVYVAKKMNENITSDHATLKATSFGRYPPLVRPEVHLQYSGKEQITVERKGPHLPCPGEACNDSFFGSYEANGSSKSTIGWYLLKKNQYQEIGLQYTTGV